MSNFAMIFFDDNAYSYDDVYSHVNIRSRGIIPFDNT